MIDRSADVPGEEPPRTQPRSDGHTTATGDEHANHVGDLAGVVMSIGVERDEEVAIRSTQEMLERSELRSAETEVRSGEHFQLDAEASRFVGRDRGGVVGARVVDEQHLDLDARSAQYRCGLFDLGEHRTDGRSTVVRGEDDRAAQFWHPGKVPPGRIGEQAAVS